MLPFNEASLVSYGAMVE